MSSSNQASAPPRVYRASNTKGTARQGDLMTPGRPSRPSAKPAGPTRKGQASAFAALDRAKKTGLNVPSSVNGLPTPIPLGSSSKTRSLAATKSSDQPASNKLDLSTVQSGQLLWYRYTGPSTLWIPAKISHVDVKPRRKDTAVTFYLAHQSQMKTVSQYDIDKGETPILELFDTCHADRKSALSARASGTDVSNTLKRLAQKGLEKLNGLSSRTGLSYNLQSSVSSVVASSKSGKSSTNARPGSNANTESDLSELDSSDGDVRVAKITPAAPKSRKRASSPTSAFTPTSSSTSTPSKKARVEPAKPGTGIATVTFIRRAAARPATASTSCTEPQTTTTNFSQESLLASLTPEDYQGPVLSGPESDSDMDIPGAGPSSTRPSHLELSVPIGISVLAHRSDSHLGSRFAPARVIGYAPNDLLSVRFYDGQENHRLPRSELLIIGDAEFGMANMEAIPELPPVPRGYRNPVLEARVKAVLPALDDIVCGKRQSARVALYEKSMSARAIDRRAAETELAGRLGGEPYSKPEMKLIRRALEARYALGMAGLAEEPDEVMGSQGDEIEMPSGSQSKRSTAKPKGRGKSAAAAASKSVEEELVHMPPDRTRRSRKGVATYAESSSDNDSDLEFVEERDGEGNVFAINSSQGQIPAANQSLLTPASILSPSELTKAPSLESVFPAPPSTLPRKDQRFIDLVLYPECLARLIVLTHLADERTGVISDTRILTAGGLSGEMDVDAPEPLALTLPSSSQSQSHTQSNPGVPEWHLRAMKQFKLDSDQYNDPRTWKTVPKVTTQYGLSADEEAQVLPQAEELLRDCHWMQALLLLKWSNSGHGKGRGRR